MPNINHIKFLMITVLISVTLASLFISDSSNYALAGEPIIDRKCRFHERNPESFKKISPINRGVTDFTSVFVLNNKKYSLHLIKFPDSTGVLCLWRPGDRFPKQLRNAALLQNKIIDKVDKDNQRTATYVVTVRGEKHEEILNTGYRLDLSQPYRPKITPLIRVYKKK